MSKNNPGLGEKPTVLVPYRNMMIVLVSHVVAGWSCNIWIKQIPRNTIKFYSPHAKIVKCGASYPFMLSILKDLSSRTNLVSSTKFRDASRCVSPPVMLQVVRPVEGRTYQPAWNLRIFTSGYIQTSKNSLEFVCVCFFCEAPRRWRQYPGMRVVFHLSILS